MSEEGAALVLRVAREECHILPRSQACHIPPVLRPVGLSQVYENWNVIVHVCIGMCVHTYLCTCWCVFQPHPPATPLGMLTLGTETIPGDTWLVSPFYLRGKQMCVHVLAHQKEHREIL